MKSFTLLLLIAVFIIPVNAPLNAQSATTTDASIDPATDQPADQMRPVGDIRTNNMIERREQRRDHIDSKQNEIIEIRQQRRDQVELHMNDRRDAVDTQMDDRRVDIQERQSDRRVDIEEHREERRQEQAQRRIERKTNVIKRMVARLDMAYERMHNILERIKSAVAGLHTDTSSIADALSRVQTQLDEARQAIDAVRAYNATDDPNTDTNRLEEFKGLVRSAVGELRDVHNATKAVVKMIKDMRPDTTDKGNENVDGGEGDANSSDTATSTDE